MKKYKFRIKGHDYEVDILQIENNHVELEVNGTHYSVELLREAPQPSKTPVLVRSELPKPKPEESGIARKDSKGSPVKAPLPGTILAVLIHPGDMVKKGQVVLRIEAMKMENDIHADKPGRVSAVHVKAGDAVLQNDVLIEVEDL